jgi:hypothetical protein
MKRKTHPLDSRCPLAARRICGVCAHFPAAAGMRGRGQICTARQETVNGTAPAADCRLWERRWEVPATMGDEL